MNLAEQVFKKYDYNHCLFCHCAYGDEAYIKGFKADMVAAMDEYAELMLREERNNKPKESEFDKITKLLKKYGEEIGQEMFIVVKDDGTGWLEDTNQYQDIEFNDIHDLKNKLEKSIDS